MAELRSRLRSWSNVGMLLALCALIVLRPKQINIRLKLGNLLEFSVDVQSPEDAQPARESRISTAAALDLVSRYNACFGEAIRREDAALLADCVTSAGMGPIADNLRTVLKSMRESNCASIDLVSMGNLRIVEDREDRAVALVDETWAYRYASGQQSQVTSQNRYELVRGDGIWKIGATEIVATPPAS